MRDGHRTPALPPDHCAERLRDALDVAFAKEHQLTAAVLAWRAEGAATDARAWDTAARTGALAPALVGVVMSVKACVDVRGWITHAGSRVLADSPPAADDAPVVASLRAAGAIIVAQTNMTEFAYSGLGLNPHYGTPCSPIYSAGDRIAGGSSSGAAVTVATGAVDAALGTDTSGSVRVPAAFCGVVGFKPSAGRYRTDGIVPLAPSFDVPGLMARSVGLCDQIDAALTSRQPAATSARLASARFVVPRGYIAPCADPIVTTTFEAAVYRLATSGAHIEEKDMAYLADVGDAARQGSMVSAESFLWHQPLIEHRGALYDPRVGPRIAAGANVRAVDYLRARQHLRDLGIRYDHDMRGFDALLTPTVWIEPPTLADVADDQRYAAANQRVLYFTELANRIDVPSLTVPAGDCSRGTGMLLTGPRHADVELLALARAVERALDQAPA